jgi:hypothetical protein
MHRSHEAYIYEGLSTLTDVGHTSAVVHAVLPR